MTIIQRRLKFCGINGTAWYIIHPDGNDNNENEYKNDYSNRARWRSVLYYIDYRGIQVNDIISMVVANIINYILFIVFGCSRYNNILCLRCRWMVYV